MILCKESWWTCGAAFGRQDQPDGDVGHCRLASYTLVWERSRAVAWPFLWTSRYKALRGICYHGDNKLWHHDVILWRPALESAALSKFGVRKGGLVKIFERHNDTIILLLRNF